MNKYGLFLSIACLTVQSATFACSCAWRGAFEQYAGNSPVVVRAKLVSYGKKLAHGDTLYASMRIKIVETIRGDISHTAITLLGDPGFLCRDYVDSRRHIIGETYLMALHNTDNEQPFGGCGEAWLRIDGDTAHGLTLTEQGWEKYSVAVTELIARLQ